MRTRHPEWVAYDQAYQQYLDDLEAWQNAQVASGGEAAAAAGTVQQIQARAGAALAAIENEYTSRTGNMRAQIEAILSGKPLFGTDGSGMIEVDPPRIIDTRFYVATYVTDWGEESAPSRVSDMIEVDQYGSVSITIANAPPNRHITHWRLYRSNTGSVSSEFQFVEEALISTRDFTDEVPGEALGEVCPTFTWLEPPFRRDQDSPAEDKPAKGPDPYLKGAVGMPNGIVAGFIDNFVAFCVPYHTYAWPVEFQITIEHPIVGLGVFGQTLFVGTKGYPYLVSGSDSASMSALKLQVDQACVSRRSICSVGMGVVYASPDGLCLASPNGVEVITSELWAREDWQKLDPRSIYAAVHEGVYYFWTSEGCYALDFVAKKLGRVQLAATALHHDVITDHLYAVVGNRVKKLFAEGRREAVWHSGIAQLTDQKPLAWVQVDGDQSISAPVIVEWYGDDVLRHTATFTDIEPKRLPAGRWLEHEIKVTTRARVTKVVLASSTAELKAV